ncbi:MAG: class I SAM-dependent methyltransferase [Theionarchaea archaeon]|nr:class I SAM-dependent methyltransferase [Theionarchaea archaeon]MBU7038825.1 class I SAM-dependent methyltransferase [Theionarchaea archaeon]
MKNVWEEIYKRGEFLSLEPHVGIDVIAGMFTEERVNRILDLGSGAGRHVVYLARKGFDVYGLDSSPTALGHTIRILGEQKLTAHVTLHDMATLPYDDAYFDAVISIQVIHHNRVRDIRKTVQEITRVLRVGGLIWVTVPVSKNEPSTGQEEIEPNTFVPLDGCEKGFPHHYFKKEELLSLFEGFCIVDLHIDRANHFSLTARKP